MIIEVVSFSSGVKGMEDAYGIFHNGFIICDGVGSCNYGGEMAKLLAEKFTNKVSFIRDVNDIYMALNQIYIDVMELVNESPSKEWKTTFIIVAGLNHNEYIISWAGNGSAFVVKPEYLIDNFRQFINVMFPDVKGDVLTATFDPGMLTNPNIIHLYSRESVMVIACTDGVYSPENAKFGKDEEGIIYTERSVILDFFLSRVWESVKQGKELGIAIRNSLEDVKEKFKNEVEDDATIGVIVPENFKF